MKFSTLAQYLERLEKTPSRLEITRILSQLFKKSTPQEIDKIVNLSLGQLAPSYRPIIFNVADKMVLSALSKAYKKDVSDINKIYKEKGDLGLVAFELDSDSSSTLSVSDVYNELSQIAQYEGAGSVEKKTTSLASLLNKLDKLSAKFVVRIPIGKLRLGFSDKTIIDALSWMHTGDKSSRAQILKAYHTTPDVAALAQKIKKSGSKNISDNISPTIGTPVLPMLAARLKSPAEMIEKMGEVAIEPKLDGLRAQIHFKRSQPVRVFTRNLNEISHMFPELTKMSHHVSDNELIIDSEAVGLDETTKKMANFQTTMTRRRKHDIKNISRGVKIKFYVFDALLVNGKNLMGKNYIARRKQLKKVIKNSKLFKLTDYIVTSDSTEIVRLSEKYQSEGLEGIIVKKTNSKYVPGRTGWRWVKMKEAQHQHAKLADTIDAVVMGYSVGKGKRASFGIGQFLVGVPDSEKIKTISKVGTGLTDEQFKELKTLLAKLQVGDKPKNYKVSKNHEPDYWVKPELVVELAADEITKSPSHTAGLALRFPRLIKFRHDKDVKSATTPKELKKLFKLQ